MKGQDANQETMNIYPWYEGYINAGSKGPKQYLGSSEEIRFEEIDSIIKVFKNSEKEIWLRRMGRAETELWYDKFRRGKCGAIRKSSCPFTRDYSRCY